MPVTDAMTFFELCLFVEASVNSTRKLIKRLGITGVRKGSVLLFSQEEADRVKDAWAARENQASSSVFESDSSGKQQY